MKATKLFSAIMAIFIAVSFLSCSKGDTGATGPQGPAGTNGTNGTNGSANVNNYTLTLTPSQWSYNSGYNQWYYNYSVSVPANSEVSAYVMSGNGEQVMPYETTTGSDAIIYSFANDWFQTSPYIQFQYTDYTSPTTAPSFDTYLYLVIIPPAAIVAHPKTNWNNYSEVKAIINSQKTTTN